MKEKIHVLYLRSGREPYGVLVMRQDGTVGLSRCHKPLDAFTKDRGVRIAYGRAAKKLSGIKETDLMSPRRSEILAHVERLSTLFQDGKLTPDFFNYEIEVNEAPKKQIPQSV